MTYRPFDNNNDWINKGTSPAVASGPVQLLKKNAIEQVAIKTLRRGESYFPGPTDSTDIATLDGSNLVGHYDPEYSGSNPELVGLQFSTHPGSPLMIPFGWMPSAFACGVKIRMACKVEGAPVDVGAVAITAKRNTRTFFPIGPTFSIDGLTFGPTDGTNVWDTTTSAWTAGTGSIDAVGLPPFKTIQPTTSSTGTGGISYYEFNLQWDSSPFAEQGEIKRFDDSIAAASGLSPLEIPGINCVALLVSSRITDSSTSTPNIVEISQGRKAIEIDDKVSSLTYGPGKFHKVVRISSGAFDPGLGVYKSTWHHVIQAVPADPTETNWLTENVKLFIWPSIPNSADATSIAPGSSISLYDAGKLTVLSVTFEEISY